MWNTLDSDFQIIRKFSSRVMAIVKFVPLVLKVAQVAETQIDIWK